MASILRLISLELRQRLKLVVLTVWTNIKNIPGHSLLWKLRLDPRLLESAVVSMIATS